MVTPGRQGGQFILSAFLDGPTPGLEEPCQVLSHSPGESLGIQVHLCLVVVGEIAHLMVTRKHLLQGIPAKLLLQLHTWDCKKKKKLHSYRSILIKIRTCHIHFYMRLCNNKNIFLHSLQYKNVFFLCCNVKTSFGTITKESPACTFPEPPTCAIRWVLPHSWHRPFYDCFDSPKSCLDEPTLKEIW